MQLETRRLEEATADYSAAFNVAKTDADRLNVYFFRRIFYQGVGRADDAQRDLDRYIPLAKQVLESQRSTLGPEHAETLGTMAFLGDALLRQQQFDEAEPLLRECLAASESNRPTIGRRSTVSHCLAAPVRSSARPEK